MKTAILATLHIDPDRQRGADSPAMAPAAIAALADSIEARGLMQPLVVELRPDMSLSLRAGERRSKAIAFLYSQGTQIKYGSTPVPLGEVPVVEYSSLSPLEAFLIELEENEKREPLTLQEKARAYATLHSLLSPVSETPRAALVQTIAAFERTTPDAVDVRTGQLHEAHQLVVIGQHLSDPDVAKAKTQREAVKIISRKIRKAEDAARAPVVAVDSQLLHGDVYDHLPRLGAGSVDCLITDPPYGIDITQLSYQSSSEQKYDDSYETWKALLPFCIDQWSRILKADADGYVFCAWERFAELSALFTGAGFEVYPKPLIWDRSPDGRLTTAEKWPRRCYECVLYFRRGNRPLLEIRGDVLRYPADRNQGNYHGAKKPVELAVDLLQRSTRPGDVVLDSFAGSGFVIRACRQLGRDVWGIEGDKAYYGLMCKLVEEADAPL